jgi:hypothetical protein
LSVSTTVFVVVHVDGVTASTNWPFVHSQMKYEYEEPRWNDIDRGKLKNSERNLSQCHFVHQISYMD